MQKSAIISILILAVLSLSFVLAAGSSTGGSSTEATRTRVTAPALAEDTNAPVTTCEDLSTPNERIKCRFENKVIAERESYSVVEEACRGRINEQKCTQLYGKLKEKGCYEKENAVEKKKCLLEQSGILNINKGGTFRSAPSESKRNYVVSLLYELQERIEKLQENNKISAEDASNLVTQIVEIKKAIIDGKPRSEIVPLMINFKKDYRTIISGVQQ